MLDAGVVDEDVDRSELADRLLHHGLDGLGPGHVGRVVAHFDPVVAGEALAQGLDIVDAP